MSLQDLVVIQEICLERELSYERRAAEAIERNDLDQAEREMKRKQRFSRLKLEMYAYLHGLKAAAHSSGSGVMRLRPASDEQHAA
jgi:hypothetical protein